MATPPLIHHTGGVLAAIDDSAYAASIADHAAWAASRLGSRLSFVHTIERGTAPAPTDLSGNLAADDRDLLLADLARLDERRGRLAQARGRQLLEQARARAADQGVADVQAQLRFGGLVDALLDLEADVRLFVIGKRGEHADFAKGHLGSNLERVVRAVHRPVLVTARGFHPVERFLLAYDGSPTTRRCVEMVAASPLLKGTACLLLMVAPESPATSAHLDWARGQLSAAGFDPEVRLVQGQADDAIVQHAQSGGASLIVMGAYGHSRIRRLVVGSTTTHVLQHCLLPLLLLR